MQKARRHPSKGLRPLVSARFQVLLHSPVRGSFHLSLTVLVRYRSLRSIQPWRMVPPGSALADGAAGFRQGFSGPALLRILLRSDSLSDTRLSRPPAGLSRPFSWQIQIDFAVLQPRRCRNTCGLGSSAFARRYLRNHCCFLLLRVLRCFSSPRSPHVRGDASSMHRVPPFGNPGIWGCLLLPRAYRSLPRPSSPLRAKASPVRP